MTDSPRVRVSTVVAVDPGEAFRVFTEEVDSWWKRSPRFRVSSDPKGTLQFEPGEGGRLLEIGEDLEDGQYEFGRVLIWKPAERLVFEFRARANVVGEESEVDVKFEKVSKGTRVTVVQTGWENLPADHPAPRRLALGAAPVWSGREWHAPASAGARVDKSP